jgi:hypothetical protein
MKHKLPCVILLQPPATKGSSASKDIPHKKLFLKDLISKEPKIHKASEMVLLTFKIIIMNSTIATGYGLDERGVGIRVPIGARIFSSRCRPDRFWGTHSLLSNGYRDSFPGIKRPGREADH